MMQPSDHFIRDQALNPSQSFIVEAPAGSGKTDLLVKRFIKLLEVSPNPQSILAITFTRKAALEMKERIIKALSSSNCAITEDDLNIMTIDAFCHRIASQYPLESGFLGRTMLQDEASLQKDLLASLLDVIADDEEGSADLVSLFQYFDNQLPETIARLLSLLKNREEWLPLVLQAQENPMADVKRLYENFSEVLTIKKQIPELFTQKWELRKRVDPALDATKQRLLEDPCLMDRYLHIAHLPDLDETPDPILAVLLRVLPIVAAHLQLILATRNETNFHEIALAALALLQDPEKGVLANLDAEIHHILVDEFQDTSNLQFQLLKFLTQEWQAGDHRTLFLVGDPKQSIYRFRNAEVGLFLEAKYQGIGNVKLQSLQLTQNFRTEAKLLDWINQTCLEFFPTDEDERLGKVKYVKSFASKNGESIQQDPEYFIDELEEANWIIKQIQTIPPNETIAILVRARSHYQAIINALDEAKLSYQVMDDKRWLDSPLVDDLISLLYAINHPQDKLAWCALLRSPFFGFSLEQITAILQSGESFSKYLQLSNEQDVYLRFHEALAVIPAQAGIQSPIIDKFLQFLLSLESLPEQNTFREALARFDFGVPIVEARIELLTIYQAKGLEFDHVFIPALQKRVAGDEAPLLYTETFYSRGEFHFFLAERQSRGREPSSLYRYLSWLEKQKAYYETMRLFYVAMTRAKKGLYFSAVGDKAPKGSFLSLL